MDYQMIPSVDKGTHALNHDIRVICCVVLNQRTSSTRNESNAAGAKIGSFPTVCPFVH